MKDQIKTENLIQIEVTKKRTHCDCCGKKSDLKGPYNPSPYEYVCDRCYNYETNHFPPKPVYSPYHSAKIGEWDIDQVRIGSIQTWIFR